MSRRRHANSFAEFFLDLDGHATEVDFLDLEIRIFEALEETAGTQSVELLFRHDLIVLERSHSKKSRALHDLAEITLCGFGVSLAGRIVTRKSSPDMKPESKDDFLNLKRRDANVGVHVVDWARKAEGCRGDVGIAASTVSDTVDHYLRQLTRYDTSGRDPVAKAVFLGGRQRWFVDSAKHQDLSAEATSHCPTDSELADDHLVFD